MSKQELEKKIKNEEIVWTTDNNNKPYKLKLKSNMKLISDELLEFNHKEHPDLAFCCLDQIFETERAAQFYSDCGNVTRIEHLPFVTWGEFKNSKLIEMTSKNGDAYELFLFVDKESKIILKNKTYNEKKEFDATEEDFYKAYTEMVELFLNDKVYCRFCNKELKVGDNFNNKICRECETKTIPYADPNTYFNSYIEGEQDTYYPYLPYASKIYKEGWVCPKCGAVMNPNERVCVNCKGNIYKLNL